MATSYLVPITRGDLVALSNFLNPEWFEESIEAMPLLEGAVAESELRNLNAWLERTRELVSAEARLANS